MPCQNFVEDEGEIAQNDLLVTINVSDRIVLSSLRPFFSCLVYSPGTYYLTYL